MIDVESLARSAVGDKKIAPFVKTDPVGIRTIFDHKRKVEGAGIEAIDAGGAGFLADPPRRFDVFENKNAALVVDVTVGTEGEVVGGVVGVVGSESAEEMDLHVGDIVPVGVLEEKDVGRGGDDDPSVPELKSGELRHV